MSYKYLLFDADNTLFDFKKAESTAFIKIHEKYNIIYKEENYNIYNEINEKYWSLFEKMEITSIELQINRFKDFLNALGISNICPQEFNDTYLQYIGENSYIYNDALEICEKVYKKKTLAIITNGLIKTQTPRIENPKINKYFTEDNFFVSEKIGHQKPKKEFFHYVFEKMNIKNKKDALIIGDSLTSDILGGNMSGVDTCWINRTLDVNNSDIKPTYEIKDLSELYDIVIKII